MKKLLPYTAAFILAGAVTLAHAVDPGKGKALFESPTLGGGTSGKSCKSCHAGGKKLGTNPGNSADTINACIQGPLGGKAIDPKGEEMQNLIAYLQTLVGKQGK